MSRRLQVGDFVKHREDEATFVVAGWLEPVDPQQQPLYQCSVVDRYEFGWRAYPGEYLSRLETVPEDRKPDAIQRAAIVLNILLEAAQDGGMREKRASLLFEEFLDHWLQNDDQEKMVILTAALERVEEVMRRTR